MEDQNASHFLFKIKGLWTPKLGGSFDK